jgi:hypothetical protein
LCVKYSEFLGKSKFICMLYILILIKTIFSY